MFVCVCACVRVQCFGAVPVYECVSMFCECVYVCVWVWVWVSVWVGECLYVCLLVFVCSVLVQSLCMSV